MLTYLVAILTYAAIYAVMGLGLNLMWGVAGMINLGIVGFFAIGAYSSAILTTAVHWPIALGMIAAMVVTAVAAGLICACLRHLRGDYFSIVTLGVAEVIRIFAENLIWLTHGTDGISRIPQPGIAWLGTAFPTAYLALCLIVLGIVYMVAERLLRSPFGRVLRAIRDDPHVAAAAGKDVGRMQSRAFCIGGGMTGLAGALYGHYTSYIVPDIFVPLLTIYIFLAVTAGGKGSNIGVLLGTVIVVFLLESSRFATDSLSWITPEQAAALRGMFIGVGFLLVLRYRPAGLCKEPVFRFPHAAVSLEASAARKF